MNKPQSLNLFLFNPESRALGSVQTSPIIRVLRPASFALWFMVFVAQLIALVGTGNTDGILLVALTTLLFSVYTPSSGTKSPTRAAASTTRWNAPADASTKTMPPDSPIAATSSSSFRRQMTRSVRNGKGFAVVLTDIVGAEKLKSNERMLASAGRNLRQSLGEGDFVARLQGPIFGAIVLDEPDQTATEKAGGLVAALGAAIPVDSSSALIPVVAVTGYEGELEVRDVLRRSQRDLQNARERAAGPLYNDPDRALSVA
ncbi:MAG: hypothetical protein U5Q44_08260 [Dehalococcoidia bacterium]|nr:hypothetical protein [Dehalococcoidia bacterium]